MWFVAIKDHEVINTAILGLWNINIGYNRILMRLINRISRLKSWGWAVPSLVHFEPASHYITIKTCLITGCCKIDEPFVFLLFLRSNGFFSCVIFIFMCLMRPKALKYSKVFNTFDTDFANLRKPWKIWNFWHHRKRGGAQQCSQTFYQILAWTWTCDWLGATMGSWA